MPVPPAPAAASSAAGSDRGADDELDRGAGGGHADCTHGPPAAVGGGFFAAADRPPPEVVHQHRRPLERPVLTITGAVGLLLGSFAWLITGSFAAAPLVFAASLTTAVTLAFAVDKAVAHAAAQIERADLRNTAACGLCGPLIRRIAAVLAVADDRADDAVAARTEAETRLALTRKRLTQCERLLAAVPDPALLTDGAGAVLFANPAAARLLGEGAARLAAIPELAGLVRETHARREAARRRTAEFETPNPATPNPAAESEPGAARPVRWRASAEPLADGAGRSLGVAVTLRDASEERVEQRRHAEFVSAVAHELKTPMAAIGAYAEMLEDGDVETPDARREVYQVIGDQCDRLTRLVDNMLSLARIESGVVEVRRRDLELNDVLKDCLEVVGRLAEEKGVSLSSELSDLYLAVNVDPDLFGQAVLNLLSNAVKYTPAGGTVRLRSRLDGDRAVVEVKDSGMGIPADDLPHIFGRFYRVERNRDAAQGTGLGLALVHSVTTELHDGAVSVESAVGEGSRFSLSIPFGHRHAGRPDAADAPAAAPTEADGRATGSSVPEPHVAPRREPVAA